jgi:uncharacterized protein
MTLDEITSTLKSSDTTPLAALRAGVAKTDELAPLIFALAEKLCRGVYLLPEQNDLLFYGLHILAAARHPNLFDRVVMIAQRSEEELNQLFPDHIPTSVGRLLLSVWNNDADALFDLIEHGEMIPDTKWALFDVLSRLTFDGRIPRERTFAFLERLEREEAFEAGDSVWWGWEDAVAKLGIKELEPALRRVWSKVINELHTEQDHAEKLEQLNRVAAAPADRTVFDEADLRPIEDPVEAVAWVERRAKMNAAWRAEREAEESIAEKDDPAEAICLTDDERDWLMGFLVSRQVPDNTMTFEMIDGFFTALVIGPATVMPSEYLPVIWGSDDGDGPLWDSTEQAQYFMNLLMKHWNAIAARRSADAPHAPFIVEFGNAERGQVWAKGFVVGMELGRAGWEPIFKNSRAAEVLMSIFALVRDEPDLFADSMPPKVLDEIVDHLPVIIQSIAAYWRDPDTPLPRREQLLLSTKIGRNEPCPCGSGKKFKKCCGNTAQPPTLH